MACYVRPSSWFFYNFRVRRWSLALIGRGFLERSATKTGVTGRPMGYRFQNSGQLATASKNTYAATPACHCTLEYLQTRGIHRRVRDGGVVWTRGHI